ncbi:GDP-mannose 4,6-dehydratase [Candidatus Pelagibacter ubique]|nr:GDP-mannose 4,6-dehydratase [Candidatus Pelagibacter ubique]
MKKVLITGGFGTLGSSLTKILCKKGFKIFILDRSKKKRIINSFGKSKIIRLYGNFNNLDQVTKILKKNKFCTIIHLGAIMQTVKSNLSPLNTFNTNITGTINILEAVRVVDKKINIIFSSSAKAYGKMKGKAFIESDALHGDYPYDVSKSAADLISQSYSKTYNLKIGIIRSGNIYGPGDNDLHRLIPGVIVRAIKDETIKLRASSKFSREYIYVDDLSSAYYKLLLYMNKNNNKKLFIYNISSKSNLNNLQIIKSIRKIINTKSKILFLNNTSIENITQRLNYNKATKELNWKPTNSFDDGISKTVNWYKKNHKNLTE